MTENQKLREALSELMSIVSIHQKATGNNFAWAEMDFAREALALPTADHIPDAGKMIETAAPVGEHELPPLPVTSYQLYYQWSDDEDGCGGSEVVDGDAYTADQMRAYARAALRAGDAVDAQRYRWLRDEAWAGYNKGKGFPHVFTIDGAGNRRTMLAEDALDASIDAAMRKGQL